MTPDPTHWQETTEEKYDEMLCVLPPEYMAGGSFVVGEPVTHRPCTISKHLAPTFDGFTIHLNKFWATKESVTIREFKALLEKLQS